MNQNGTPATETSGFALQRFVFVLALSVLIAVAWTDPLPVRGLEEVGHAQVELRSGF